LNTKKTKRVMVIGCCGAGKSTFSKKLHSILGIELIHLDQYYWKPNWVESDSEEWKHKVQELAAKPEWIIDGNYGGTMNFRMDRADTIIFLDYSTISCLWRITKRINKYKGRTRPDMPEGCHERFDLEFYHYVATYNLLRRKKHYRQLEQHKVNKQTFVLRNDKECENFLKKLEKKFSLSQNL